MIDPAFLPELSERVAESFLENYRSIIDNIYARGLLDDFLEMTGMKRLKNIASEIPMTKTKKFVVIGEKCGSHANDYKELIRSMGLSVENVVLCLNYSDSKNHNFEKYRYNPDYGAIFFGAHPHKNKCNGEYNTVVTKMMKEPGYPKVYLLGDPKHPKLTISSLQKAIAQAFNEKVLGAVNH